MIYDYKINEQALAEFKQAIFKTKGRANTKLGLVLATAGLNSDEIIGVLQKPTNENNFKNSHYLQTEMINIDYGRYMLNLNKEQVKRGYKQSKLYAKDWLILQKILGQELYDAMPDKVPVNRNDLKHIIKRYKQFSKVVNTLTDKQKSVLFGDKNFVQYICPVSGTNCFINYENYVMNEPTFPRCDNGSNELSTEHKNMIDDIMFYYNKCALTLCLMATEMKKEQYKDETFKTNQRYALNALRHQTSCNKYYYTEDAMAKRFDKVFKLSTIFDLLYEMGIGLQAVDKDKFVCDNKVKLYSQQLFSITKTMYKLYSKCKPFERKNLREMTIEKLQIVSNDFMDNTYSFFELNWTDEQDKKVLEGTEKDQEKVTKKSINETKKVSREIAVQTIEVNDFSELFTTKE